MTDLTFANEHVNTQEPTPTHTYPAPPNSERVRVTATRVKRLTNALHTTDNANNKAAVLLSELLTGRESDNSTIANRIKELSEIVSTIGALTEQVSAIGDNLLSEFDAFR